MRKVSCDNSPSSRSKHNCIYNKRLCCTLKTSRKTIGAKLIVNGKTLPLVPESSLKNSMQVLPSAAQNCVYVISNETNIRNDGQAAYFDYSLRIDNSCTGTAVTSGKWNAI